MACSLNGESKLYEDFKKELDAFEFTMAEPSVLARLAYIEQFMIKQQQAGVFKEL